MESPYSAVKRKSARKAIQFESDQENEEDDDEYGLEPMDTSESRADEPTPQEIFERRAEKRWPKSYDDYDPLLEMHYKPKPKKGGSFEHSPIPGTPKVQYTEKEIEYFLNTAINRSKAIIKRNQGVININPKTTLFISLFTNESPLGSKEFVGRWKESSETVTTKSVSFGFEKDQSVQFAAIGYINTATNMAKALSLFKIDPKQQQQRPPMNILFTLRPLTIGDTWIVNGDSYDSKNYPPGINSIVVSYAYEGGLEVEYSQILILQAKK